MATLITQDFEREIAEKTVNGGVIQYDEFIFAMIPNLSADNLAQHLTIPSESLIKHRQAVSKAGVINENAVVYSVTLGTEIGDFDFNWIGLINKRTNKLAVAVQADTIKKTRNKNNVQGNSLTRNVLLEFAGAKQLTQINVSADTWQIDFTVRLHGLDEKIRLTNRDLYGRAVFFDDAFLVKRGAGNNYTIDAGHAYIEGVRAEIKQAQTIQATSLPCSIYLDVVHHCTVTGAYETELKFLKQSKSDYLDTANRQHYVQIIADIDSAGAVTDRRLLSPWFGITPKNLDDTTESTRDKTGHTHKLPLASLIKKGLVQLYSGNDSDNEEMAATPKAVKVLKGFIDSLTRSLNNYIPNSKKSDETNSSSSDNVATSRAIKMTYDAATRSASDVEAGQVVLSHIINGVNKLKAASEFALNELNKIALKNSGTQTLNNGDLEIKNGSYSSVKLYNNNNKHVRIEAQPDSTQDSFAHIILKNQQDSNLKRLKLPRKDGILVVENDFLYQKIGTFEVRKYPDGTMIQTYFADFNDVHEMNAGIGSKGKKQLSWAVSFIEKPMVFGNITSSLDGHHDVGVNILTGSTNTTLYWYNYEHGTLEQGACRLQFFAIGRWK